jgi:hypothetical protein
MRYLPNRLLSTIVLLLAFVSLQAQEMGQQPTAVERVDQAFDVYLSGVKVAVVRMPKADQDNVDASSDPSKSYGAQLRQYLLKIGFEHVYLTSLEQKEFYQGASNFCDATFVEFNFRQEGKRFMGIELVFNTCKGGRYIFRTKREFLAYPVDTYAFLKEVCEQMFLPKPITYNSANRLQLPKQPNNVTIQSLTEEFKKRPAEGIEGVYELVRANATDLKYKLGIRKVGDVFEAYYLTGEVNNDDWNAGELKAKITPTAKPNFYLVQWYSLLKQVKEDVTANINDNGNLDFEFPLEQQTQSFVKLLPIASATTTPPKETKKH